VILDPECGGVGRSRGERGNGVWVVVFQIVVWSYIRYNTSNPTKTGPAAVPSPRPVGCALMGRVRQPAGLRTFPI